MWHTRTKREWLEGEPLYADVCCVSHDQLYVGLLRKHDLGHTAYMSLIFTPPPVEGRGIVIERFLSFSLFIYLFLSFFISLFVSLSATLRENGWTDLHEMFREGVE